MLRHEPQCRRRLDVARLILDRRVGAYQVPKGWFIWAAGNRKKDRASVFEMPAPLANRFLHLQVENEFIFPPDSLREPEWEKLSVEEIYELLLKEVKILKLPYSDLLSQSLETNGTSSLSQAQQEALKTHWKNALQQATIIARTTNQGNLPAGLERQLTELSHAQLDWRTYLWRYLVQTPTDFQGFDRRFVGRGLYLDAIEGESVQVYVCIDTSGSVGEGELKLFLSEVQGILGAYPHLNCSLYYADAEAYGPYPLTSDSSIPKPVGGGGTSFIPFFERVEATREFDTQGVCVYLTDGYGEFPAEPFLPVLWVVTPGGLGLEQFPFGEAVRLVSVG